MNALACFFSALRTTLFSALALSLCISAVAAEEATATAPAEAAAPATETPSATLPAGAIAGNVFDDATGQPVLGAKVSVVLPSGAVAVETDLAGYYKIENVPVGTYTVGVYTSGFPDTEIEGVTVASGETASASVSLRKVIATATAGKDEKVEVLETFKVTAKASETSDPGLRSMRQQAAVAVDAISAAQLGKFIGNDVSDVMIRLPGVSVARGQFAVVRGLSERYNPIMLDGIVLPSADPERQSPQMDIFPTRLMDAIVISKGFEASLPATSSGGAIDLRTRPFPEAKYTQVQFGLRAEEDVFKGGRFLTYDSGGNSDRLASGKNDRASAPNIFIPQESDTLLRNGVTPLSTRSQNMPLGYRFNISHGNSKVLDSDKGRKLGYSVNFGYDSSFATEEGRDLSITNYLLSGTGAQPAVSGKVSDATGFNSSEYVESQEEFRMGFLGTLGYAINRRNQIALSLFISQIGIDRATDRFYSVDNISTYADLQNFYAYLETKPSAFAFQNVFLGAGFGGGEYVRDAYELYYRQRNLTDLKLSGKHHFSGDKNMKLDWAIARITTEQDEPDFRFVPVFIDENTGAYSIGVPPAPSARNFVRSWRVTEEKSWAGKTGLQWNFDALGLTDIVARLGVYMDRTDRRYDETSINFFGFSPFNVAGFVAFTPADLPQWMSGVNGFPGGANATGGVAAERKLDSFYASLTFPILKNRRWADRLELSVGVRREAFLMTSRGSGLLFGSASVAGFYYEARQALGFPDSVVFQSEFSGTIDERAYHPSVAVTYSPLKNFNVRTSYSKTKARPSFREVGPYFTRDESTDETQVGNVRLVTSDVENLDVRFEYFFGSSRDLVALSFFAKDIENPIERIATRTANNGNVVTWVNNSNPAKLRGVEAEFSKKLDFLGKLGAMFTLGGNGTLIDATVRRFSAFEDLGDSKTNLFGAERPLFDQPKWILNGNLSFDHREAGFSTTLSYFAISDVLQTVRFLSWDSYVAKHDRLDLTLSKQFGTSWSLKATAKNLMDSERKRISDPAHTTEPLEYSRYKDGRSYSLTVNKEF